MPTAQCKGSHGGNHHYLSNKVAAKFRIGQDSRKRISPNIEKRMIPSCLATFQRVFSLDRLVKK